MAKLTAEQMRVLRENLPKFSALNDFEKGRVVGRIEVLADIFPAHDAPKPATAEQ